MNQDIPYWRKTPHLFVKARWGPKYCSLCFDPKRRVIHLKPEKLHENDPRRFDQRDYRVAHPEVTLWRVEGWSENGASCSYSALYDKEGAIARAKELARNGDQDGRKYEHYLVLEMVYEKICNTNYHPVPGLE